MGVPSVVAEAEQISAGSIRLAREISHASSGDDLGRVMRAAMANSGGAYASVRQVVKTRVDDLGGAGEAEGLFMLAADMATTEALMGDELDQGQRNELRALWVDLLSRD